MPSAAAAALLSTLSTLSTSMAFAFLSSSLLTKLSVAEKGSSALEGALFRVILRTQ
jgi:hypothetical protein